MESNVTIVDYGSGNIGSLRSAFENIGSKVDIGNTPLHIAKASIIVLPGVGSFDNACKQLAYLNLTNAIREAVLVDRKKILGICLGMQLFFDSSEEGNGRERGLQIFPDKVHRFKNTGAMAIPHTGFNSVSIAKDHAMNRLNFHSRLLKGIKNPYFYFVHSYKLDIAAKMNGLKLQTDYGEAFLSGYEEKNIFLTQFHPEKSQTNGLKMLRNFIES